jgi:hypothetical protein
MMWTNNWCRLTAIAAMPLNVPSEISKNTLWQDSVQSTPPFHFTCGTDSYRRRKSHRISCGPRDSTHNYPSQLTFMTSWIITKQLLLRQGEKSLHTRNQEIDALGRPMGNMAIPWVPQCIITYIKMYTSRPRIVNASWTHSSSSHTIIKCHRYLRPTD